MGVQNILQQFVLRSTVISKDDTEGGLVTPESSPAVYGPGVGPRFNVGQYVDTGQFRMGNAGERLWTDRASWCVMVASFDSTAHRSYLAHISPGQSFLGPAGTLRAYSAAPPGNLTLCTMRTHLQNSLASDAAASQSALWSVVKMLDNAYSAAQNGAGDRGAMAVAGNTTIITGFRGVDWDVYWGLAVEDYGIFPLSPYKENWLWNAQF